MGFNITGIAIDKNLSNDIDQIAKAFGWKLKEVGTVDFDTASANWTADDDCFACFVEKGTLLFVSGEKINENYSLPDQSCFSFCLSEMTMIFYINLDIKGEVKRRILLMEGDLIENIGRPLDIDLDPDFPNDASDIIWHQINQVCGKSFGDMFDDQELKPVHYKIIS